MYLKKTTCLVTALLTILPILSFRLEAQNTEAGVDAERPTQELSLKVAFRQGKRQIDQSYMDNAANISAFTSALSKLTYDSTLQVISVDIIGGASIEGTAELNRDLSNNRANRMVEILRQYATVPQNLVHVDSRGVNWEDVLEMVRADVNVPSRDKVIAILKHTPEPVRKSTLESVDSGAPWKYMYEHIFPYVRTGKMTVTFRAVPKQPQAQPAAVHDTVYVVQRDTVYHVHVDDPGSTKNINQNIMNVNTDRYGRRRGRAADDPDYVPNTRIDKLDSLLRTPIMAFRSNLLIPLMNIGAEVPIGNRWSLSADWYYPWAWRLPDHKDCFEFLGGTAEARYWFGRRHRPGEKNTKYRLLGHSIGLVAGAGYYDFQEKWAGFQGEYGAAGIDYQYAMPLGKKGNVHLEFDLTLGVITAQNIPYDVFSSGGILLHRDGLVERFNWAGPIKGGVSLVVPIFKKEKVSSSTVYTSQPASSAAVHPVMTPAPFETGASKITTNELNVSRKELRKYVRTEQKTSKAVAPSPKAEKKSDHKAGTHIKEAKI